MSNPNPNQWTTCWVTTSTVDDDGIVQAVDDTGTPVPEVDQLGLPGHYSKADIGSRGYMLRLENGGKIVACYTSPPIGVDAAVAGEAGLFVDGTILRIVPNAVTNGVFEIRHAPALGGISLGATDLSDGVPLLVVRTTDPVVTPAGIGVGTCQATTTRVVAT
jgi:hypothetical protein